MVGKVISTFTSTGLFESTHPISDLLLDIVGPIGVPNESHNLIVTYVSILSFDAGFNICKWNLCVPPGIILNPNCSVIKDSTK